LHGERSGEISTTLSDGIEALDGYYARFLPAMALAVWVPLSILVFVFPLDWQSALVMLLTAPLIPFFMVLIGKGAERLNRDQWRKLSRLGARFLDTIQGLGTLKMFNATRREAQLIARASEEYRVSTMKVLRVAFLSSLALEFFATISIAVVAVLIGFRLLFGEMDFLAGFFVLLLAPEFYLPLRSLGTHYHGRMDAIAAVERMIEILQTPGPVETDRSLVPEATQHTIRFDRVAFAYDERPALNEVSFTIEPGERVALVGPSGAGKSTVVNLLLGFIQAQSGEIRIDGNRLDDIDLAWWRRQIAWIPQRPRLFHGSVAENVALGREALSTTDIHDALTQANALEFVEALPQGLDTLIGDGGQGLSGGQTQRLALARAFARDAQLLILDEPTAHLDRESEALLQQSISSFARKRSLLTVAHRLQTIRDADRIIVIADGRVAQQGSHSELVNDSGIYRKLIDAQAIAA
jgi:ATP-binding cassette subfamily C protein CydD